jgi:4-hydroxybutyrate CoA-transferase
MVATKQPAALNVESIRQHFVDGVTVFISGGCGQPDAVLALVAEAALSSAFRVIDCSVPGMTAMALDQLSSKAVLNTGFLLGTYRPFHEQGRLEYVPAYHSARYRAMEEEYNIDIALIKVSKPNAQGFCSASLHADYSPEMLAKTDVIIAEINPNMPFIDDALQIALADIDYTVSSDAPLREYGVSAGSELDLVIAQHIAELVDDGDCLQLGIGALPVSILQTLGDKKDLGVHTGLLTEAFVPLVEAGVVNGRKKTIDKGKMTTGIVAGSRDFYQWCGNYSGLSMRPVSYTHNAGVLAQIDNLVAINTTLEIDLFGQINSETIRGKQIGGGGGLVDFLRGARSSRGGRSIIALQATAKGGSISKIAPLLKTAPVTAIRNDVDYVVTEYGVARLSNLSVEKRAEALIAIAHPDFREELTVQWSALMSAF